MQAPGFSFLLSRLHMKSGRPAGQQKNSNNIVSNNNEKIDCTTEDLIRPEVILANQGSREPGQVKGQEWPLTPKMPKLNRKLTNFASHPDHGVHIKQTRPDDLKTKEVDTKGEKVGEVGWDGSGLRRDVVRVDVRHTENTKRLQKDLPQTSQLLNSPQKSHPGVGR